MRFLLKLLVAGVLAGASVFLVATNTNQHQGWRIAAAIIAALPSAFLAGSALSNRFRPSDKARSSVETSLRRAMLDLSEETLGGKRVFGDEVAAMSFHVWLVPLWWRRLYRPRRSGRRLLEGWLGPDRAKRVIFRPKLDRFTVFCFQELTPSEVTFRKGLGLVGICIERNHGNRAQIVDFETADMDKLLQCSREEWAQAPQEKTLNLRHDDFDKLADKYGQAAAFVIREKATGEPVGCLTFELPPNSKVRIQDYEAALTPSGDIALTADGAVLIRKIKNTRDLVQDLVSMKQLSG